MEPLRIRCRPENLFVYPESWGTYIHLDSLLLRAVLLERHGAGYYTLPPVTPSTPPAKLETTGVPLERRERGGVWYWACSWADVEAASLKEAETAWIRSYPNHDAITYLDGKRLLVKSWQGPDKLYNTPVYVQVVDELVWYAAGDRAEIARLLETYYPAIGKKAAYGQGQLEFYPDGSRWQIDPWPQDWSERDGDGRLTRGLPAILDTAFPLDMVRAPVRPPYYCLANFAFLEMPG